MSLYMWMTSWYVSNQNISTQLRENCNWEENKQMGSSKWIQVLSNKNKNVSIFITKNDYVMPSAWNLMVQRSYKFLGIIFDKKLIFISHLKDLKAKYNKTLQLLRMVAHKEWGADRKTLLLFAIN